jgi:hypothetical protein
MRVLEVGEDGQDQKEKRHHITGVALFACLAGSRFTCEGRRDRWF